ncbi:SpoIIE family protein phosphatase [Streptomyces sp. NPDC096040]|uniref:SpoIIE family protein phosphatase n=1 Tax=Streptomyces sp. NPDC096040 TaxID=3155541 RepID=UPI003328758D
MAYDSEGRGASDAGTVTLDALFTQAPVGLAVLDSDLRVARINTATPAMQGTREEDVIGRVFPGSHYVVDAEPAEAVVREVLESGVPVRGRILRARPPAHHGQERLYEVSAFRLLDSDSAVLGVTITVVDVTDRERALSRLRILDTVRERVGRTLDMVATCQELADAVVPEFADVAVVELVDAVIRGDDPPPSPVPSCLTLQRAAFRSSAGENQPQAHPVGHVGVLPAPTPFSRALAELVPQAVGLTPDLPWLNTDPARGRAIRESGAHSLLVIPLTLRNAVLGLVSLYRTTSESPYDEDDRALALDLARHTALCTDNARRYTRDHSVAATVLQHMVPVHAASRTALETAGIARPGDGSRAWYDTIALSGARTALVAGSVSGEGIQATMAMGQLRTVIHSLASLDLDPEDLLARLNDTATRLMAERASLSTGNPPQRPPATASCVYAVYDPLTRTCTIARAGHPGPVIAQPDGTVDRPDTSPGPRLGSTDQAPFASTSIQIPHGSVMAFPAPPALASHLTTATRLLQAGPALADLTLQKLCDDILCTLPADVGDDGAVFLLARPRPFPPDRVAIWPLDNELTAAAAARDFATDQLARWNVAEEIAFNTELIVSELVTNAIRYGSPPLELRLILDRALTCEVSDSSATAPHLRHARTTDEGGRGLFIVAQLAQTWGARYSADGKTIWTEQTLEGAHR